MLWIRNAQVQCFQIPPISQPRIWNTLRYLKYHLIEKKARHTSWVFRRLLNLATRSWLLMGPVCRSKVLASSSETTPGAGALAGALAAAAAAAPLAAPPLPVSFFAVVDFPPWNRQSQGCSHQEWENIVYLKPKNWSDLIIWLLLV